jgi:hypothetical protein
MTGKYSGYSLSFSCHQSCSGTEQETQGTKIDGKKIWARFLSIFLPSMFLPISPGCDSGGGGADGTVGLPNPALRDKVWRPRRVTSDKIFLSSMFLSGFPGAASPIVESFTA